jgi:hypothetical protein
VGDARFVDKLNGFRVASSDISNAAAISSACFLPERKMISKYSHLSLDSALLVLKQWSLASTKLRLRMVSALAGVSFSGSVLVAKDPTALSVRFVWSVGEGVAVSWFDAERLRASAEEPRRWLAFDKPGEFRFVLEVDEGEPLEEINLDDFDFASALEQ